MYSMYYLFNSIHELVKQELKPKEDSRKKYTCFLGTFETRLIWSNIIGIGFLHLLSLYAVLIFPFRHKPELVLYGLLLGFIGGMGITAGAHRLFTHRSYKAKPLLKIGLLLAYSMAGQNSLKEWVRDHRVHHKFCETDADPHNSKRGFFFAHVGWLMMRKHEDVIAKGKQVDLSDLDDDPIIEFFQKYFLFFKIICCFIVPTILPPLLWNEDWWWTFYAITVFRYCIQLNATWSVNSAAHLWGMRPYDKTIQPVENFFVSLCALGEGWHNYHHTFPWDYRTSESGRFNPTKIFLDVCERLGLAYDMKTPSDALVKKVIEKTGDGTHWMHGKEIFEINNEDHKGL